jgi:hypothetical protein
MHRESTGVGPSARALGVLLPLVGVLSAVTPAAADTSTWYSLAPGVSFIDQGEELASGLLELDLGVGLPARGPLVLGAVGHLAAHFAVGADLGGAARLTTGGYSRGEWGLGMDLGAHYRVATTGGAAGYGRLLVGGPFGLVGALGGSYGEGSVTTLTFSLGLDLARLTVHRTSGTSWYPSPLASQSDR